MFMQPSGAALRRGGFPMSEQHSETTSFQKLCKPFQLAFLTF